MYVKPLKYISNIIRRVSTKPLSNGEIQPHIFNRNPRNLERLQIERKPFGYTLEKDRMSYWHKLEVTQSRHVKAQLIHNTGKVVVQASTNEWCLKKHLYSKTDRMAYIILGRVFAERCLESGIIYFACPKEYKRKEKTKLKLLLEVLQNEGLFLKEPYVFNIYNIWDRKRKKKPWMVLED